MSAQGLSLPHLVRLEAAEVPEPYKRLLVHSLDMTPTLESFYRSTMDLRYWPGTPGRHL